MAGWEWLNKELSATRPLGETSLVLPNFDYFPATDATGHDLVEHLFGHVCGLMSVERRAFDLVPHNDFPDDLPKSAARGPYAAGTFSMTADARMMITYHPSLVDKPPALIGTLAHEIAHGIVRSFDHSPPGGWEMEEFAVELTTVYFGFGVFGANKAFQATFGKGWRGWLGAWSMSSSGYLSQEQWAFALAVFMALRGDDGQVADEWLEPVLKKMLKQASAYLAANPDLLASVRA